MAGTGKSESAVLIHTWNVDKHSCFKLAYVIKLFNQTGSPRFNCKAISRGGDLLVSGGQAPSDKLRSSYLVMSK